MRYHIYWQTQFGKWQKYTTKHNEADAFRVMQRKANSDGKRYKLTSDDGRLIDLIG
tara:strand:+ start:3651 stop:3818 length:168 start_codon:yes stop_codon:yes gene_type:complete